MKQAHAGARARGGPTEKQFMGAVVQYAKAVGWSVYHTFDARRSEPGFPDLCMVRAGRLVWAELKVGKGRLTPAQERWLGVLGGVPCCEVYCWYCTDEYWQEIERVLR